MRKPLYFSLVLLSLISSVFAEDSAMPDPALTPGDGVEGVTVEQLQQVGYSKQHRHVPEALRRAVFAEYEIPWEKRNDYEVDHLISLSIGGSNSIKNLWPEPLRLNVGGKDLGAVTKDALEDRLHWLVISGQLDLKQAQKEISTDWISAYRKYIGEPPNYQVGDRP
jgi:hypothetical protein